MSTDHQSTVIADFLRSVTRPECELCGSEIHSVWDSVPLDPNEDAWGASRKMPDLVVCTRCTGWLGDRLGCKCCSWKAGCVGALVQHHQDKHENFWRHLRIVDDSRIRSNPNLKFDQLCSELQTCGIQELLSHLFFEWPTLPVQPTKLQRYGTLRETWPISTEQLCGLILAGGKYDQRQADSVIQELLDCQSCEVQDTDMMLIWPDVQHIFNNVLGERNKDVEMLVGVAGENLVPSLTLKIPETMIEQMLIGEWRMYCQNIADGANSLPFSYGLIIDSVTMTEQVGRCKKFAFTGHPRQAGKYELQDGTCIWNAKGNGRLFMEYCECWPGGNKDHLRARLKSNGKFACYSGAGFIQKARKQATLPTDPEERMKSKYYAGDEAAANI